MKTWVLRISTIITLLFAILIGCQKETKSPADYVNPFIGTDAGGHTFPGACLPFGMVQLSPDNGYKGVKAYGYIGKNIIGFSHTHLSGTGPFTKTHYNNVLIMPTVGNLETKPGIAKELDFLAAEKLNEVLAGMSEKKSKIGKSCHRRFGRKKNKPLQIKQNLKFSTAKTGRKRAILPMNLSRDTNRLTVMMKKKQAPDITPFS